MKRVSKITLAVVLALCTALCAAACNKIRTEPVVIVATSEIMEITGETTLHDYMKALKSADLLKFETTDSTFGAYLTSVNGVAATVTSGWMVYSSDTANTSTEYGSFDYENAKLGQTNTGIDSLIVKEGCVYVFNLESFN